MYQICFYVPVTHAEAVKEAMFAQGAGQQGNYSHVSWQTLGEGQFMPLPGSHPTIGTSNYLERVAELKVEMICEEGCIANVIAALTNTHPYEKPAYSVWKLITF